jgi:hypothetical protein
MKTLQYFLPLEGGHLEAKQVKQQQIFICLLKTVTHDGFLVFMH